MSTTRADRLRIGIIGSGSVGSALGKRLARAGHDVRYGSRDPGAASVQAAVADSPNSQAVSMEASTEGADAVILAVPRDAVPAVAQHLAGAGDIPVIDATNSLGGETGPSGGEALAQRLPQARVVKAFNTTGFENMLDPAAYADGPPSMLYAGDDSDAKAIAAMIIAAVGFEPVDAGGLANGALLEGLARLWIALAYDAGHGRGIAFRLLTLPAAGGGRA
jgi:8-hydroxy-5-deazaflavin:NADPH oxidoreductase